MNIFRQARKQKGMSQQTAAKELETFQSWISNVEKEKIEPSLFWAWQLSELYGINFRAVGEYYGGRKRYRKDEDTRENEGTIG